MKQRLKTVLVVVCSAACLFASDNRINALARSGQHQGVAADIRAKRMQSLPSFLEQRTGRKYGSIVLVLDGIHNPANLGMILRSATAAGLDGVVVPDEGTAKIGAVAIKASAGVAFKAPILRIDNASMEILEN